MRQAARAHCERIRLMIKILDMKRVSENEIFLRGLSEPDVFASVAEIIAEVRARGDAAVLDFT